MWKWNSPIFNQKQNTQAHKHSPNTYGSQATQPNQQHLQHQPTNPPTDQPNMPSPKHMIIRSSCLSATIKMDRNVRISLWTIRPPRSNNNYSCTFATAVYFWPPFARHTINAFTAYYDRYEALFEDTNVLCRFSCGCLTVLYKTYLYLIFSDHR